MNASMITAMSSMNALQQKLDLFADNIANVGTVGYKRKESSFEDLLTNMKAQPEAFQQSGRLTPLGYNQGWGAKMTEIVTNFTQGPLKETGLSTDLALEGNALFEVIADDAGNRAYTRSGAFHLTLDANGDNILTTENGQPIVAIITDANGNATEGRIVLPHGSEMQVAADGTVLGVSSQGSTVLGRLKLLEVTRPDALTAVADNLFAVAGGINADEVVQAVVPSEENGIAVRQGFLEQSNVDFTQEMTELIIVQRAYQLAARAISSSDTMMGLANNMRA